MSSSSSTSSPKEELSPPVLRALLSQNLSNTDAFIAHLTKLLSTPSGIDRFLSLVYYTSMFLAPQLARLAAHTTVKLPTPVPLLVITPTAATLSTLSTRIRTLASKVSEVRMFLRLWSLLGIYAWAQGTISSPPKDPVVRAITISQVAFGAVYQVLENLAYLNTHDIIGSLSKRTVGRFWLWSTRCWAAHIALEFVRLERVRWLARDGAKGKEVAAKEDAEARANWWKAWVGNAAYAPLSLHWSLERGLISDTTVGALGGVAAAISFTDAWKKAGTKV